MNNLKIKQKPYNMPKIGQIVVYKPTQEDKNYMSNPNTICNSQDLLPAMIVRIWNENCVNLKVFIDGVQDLWKTSVMLGDGEGSWKPQE